MVSTREHAPILYYHHPCHDLDPVQSYKSAVGNALQAAQDVLGSLGLEPELPSAEQAVQEVEVNCYDSDSLSSPPTSSGGESEGEIDPLLDFSRDDEFTYRPGKPMIYNLLKTQQALGGLATISHEIQEAKQQKQKAEEAERQRTQVLVAAEASFTPTFKGKRAVPESRLPQKREPFPSREKKLPDATTQQQSRTGSSLPLPAAVSRIEPRTKPGAKFHETVELPVVATQQQNKSGSSVPPPPAVSGIEPIAKPKVKAPQPFPTKRPNTMDNQQLQDITTHQLSKLSPPPVAVSGREPAPIEDLPPPVPPYSPHSPETHVWTNKPRERPKPGHVPLRIKKRSGERLPASEREGHVTDPGYKRRFSPPHVQPTPDKLPENGEWNCTSEAIVVHDLYSLQLQFMTGGWRKWGCG